MNQTEPLPTGPEVRARWRALAGKIATPVLENLAAGKLKERLPRQRHPERADENLGGFPYLEVIARTLVGLGPWLSTGEGHPARLRSLVPEAIRHLVDPASPDFGEFARPGQPVVDGAFLALAFLRAPRFWDELPSDTQAQVIKALRALRKILPHQNNWLLFSAMIETFFAEIGEDWDAMRIDYAVRKHMDWYAGDGWYGDGPAFHTDHYNSFVIQPFLVLIADKLGDRMPWDFVGKIRARAQRYAVVQERLIAPDGHFPAFGRSLAYRCGAFQHLADTAFRKDLPDEMEPGQVRVALDAVIRRTLEAPGTFDAEGWLRIGLAGDQPGLGETYINTGSLYLCSTAFLPLGLPEEDLFWKAESRPCSSQRIWSGEDFPADKAIYD